MFKPYNSNGNNLTIQRQEKNEGLFDNVSLQFHQPWFHVVYQRLSSQKYEPYKIVFISKPQTLIALIEQRNIKIHNVAIVTPAHINKTECWKMESLLEIQKGTEPGMPVNQESFIYTVESGDSYVDSALLTEIARLENIEVIIRI